MDHNQLQPILVANRQRYEDQIWDMLCEVSHDGEARRRDRLAAELFSLLYKVEPCLTPAPAAGFDSEWEAVQRMWKSGHLKLLRERTSVPNEDAALMSYVASKELLEDVKRAAEAIREWKDGGLDFGGLPQSTEQSVNNAAKAMDDLKSAIQALTGSSSLGSDGDDEEGAGDDGSPGGSGRGRSESHPPSRKNLQAAFAFMKALDDQKTLELLHWVGRLAPIHRRSQEEHWSRKPVRPTRITRSRNLMRQTPAQAAKFCHPRMLSAWRKEFVEGQLQTYHLEDREVPGKGPIIGLNDKSGSMRGQQKDAWATALMTLLIQQARQEGRDFWNLPFHDFVLGRGGLGLSSDGTTLVPYGHRWQPDPSRRVWEPYFFPKGQVNPADFLECYALSASGGTDGLNAVRAAWTVLDRYPDAKEADVLMVTDGMCGMRNHAAEIRAEFERRNARLWMVLMVGGDMREALSVTDEERIIQIVDLQNPHRLRQVLDKVTTISA